MIDIKVIGKNLLNPMKPNSYSQVSIFNDGGLIIL